VPVGPYPDPAAFIIGELFRHHRLRQGWGVPGLSLRQSEDDWVSHYLYAAWRHWGAEVDWVDIYKDLRTYETNRQQLRERLVSEGELER
jgi:hypothetical protein